MEIKQQNIAPTSWRPLKKEYAKGGVSHCNIKDFHKNIPQRDYNLLMDYIKEVDLNFQEDKLNVIYKEGAKGKVYWYKVAIDSGKNIIYLKKNNYRQDIGMTFEKDVLMLNVKDKYKVLASRGIGNRWKKIINISEVNFAMGKNAGLNTDVNYTTDRIPFSEIQSELDNDLVVLIGRLFNSEFTAYYTKINHDKQIEYLYLTSQMKNGNVITLVYLRKGCPTNKIRLKIDTIGDVRHGIVSNDILLQRYGDINSKQYKIIAKKTLNGSWELIS